MEQNETKEYSEVTEDIADMDELTDTLINDDTIDLTKDNELTEIPKTQKVIE